MLLSLPAPPTVGMDLRVVGGEITKIPWLRTELEEQLLAAIDEVMLWPRRIVVPAEAAGKVLLGKEQLEALEHDVRRRKRARTPDEQISAHSAAHVFGRRLGTGPAAARRARARGAARAPGERRRQSRDAEPRSLCARHLLW